MCCKSLEINKHTKKFCSTNLLQDKIYNNMFTVRNTKWQKVILHGGKGCWFGACVCVCICRYICKHQCLYIKYLNESVSQLLVNSLSLALSLSPFSEIYVPNAGSYSPPFSGWPSALNDSGVVIFTSLNFWISSRVKIEKDSALGLRCSIFWPLLFNFRILKSQSVLQSWKETAS
jgi:hypothetical protein